MKKFYATFAGILLLLVPVIAAEETGWMSLFNGKDLEGWEQKGGAAKYRFEGGMVIGTSVPNTGNSFLCTRKEYGDFILELDYKGDPGLNSGVQVRSKCFDKATEFESNGKTIKVPAGRVHGLQVEIDPSPRAWSAGIYEEGARGWLVDLKNNEPARKAYKLGDWNHYRIECKGDTIKTWINGVMAAELKDTRVMSGLIGLQVHGVGKNETALEIRFKNVRLKPL